MVKNRDFNLIASRQNFRSFYSTARKQSPSTSSGTTQRFATKSSVFLCVSAFSASSKFFNQFALPQRNKGHKDPQRNPLRSSATPLSLRLQISSKILITTSSSTAPPSTETSFDDTHTARILPTLFDDRQYHSPCSYSIYTPEILRAVLT